MNKLGSSLIAIFGALALTLGLAMQSQAQGRSDLVLAALENTAHMPGELIVQFRPGVSAQGKAKALGRVAAKREELLVNEAWRGDSKGDLELVSLPPGIGIATAVRGLEQDANVEFAEPNWIYFHTAASNDTYYTNGSLWGMYASDTTPSNAYGSQAAKAWATDNTNCKSVWVGIIDEGYMYAHEDLAANAGINPGEIAGNGVDDDGNGYVDDVYGWDFDGNNNTVYDGSQDDHGTHVAGTIGGVGGNGKGVAGVCWQVNLMDAKFLGRRGGTTANAVKAVDYFTDLKTRHGLDFVATNNSWGGGGYSQSLYDAIERANNANILFVAAAGNGGGDGVGDNNDATPHYPSSYTNDNIIAVAAITSTGAISGFSNYGIASVDIGAPGSGITSTLPNNSYGSYSGTSMATPHVTGATALYAATHAGATAADIKLGILSSAKPTASLSGKTVTGGRLDVSSFTGSGGGGGTNVPPTASFTFSCLDLACSFSDTSTDDNTVSSWSWNFGDGSTSSVQYPSHAYAAAGTYTVTLTVADNEGATNTASESVTVTAPPTSNINLSAVGRKVKGVMHVDLSWSPTAAGNVDVYRNNVPVATTSNDGLYTDGFLGKGSATFTYQVCTAGSTDSCSNTVTVVF